MSRKVGAQDMDDGLESDAEGGSGGLASGGLRLPPTATEDNSRYPAGPASASEVFLWPSWVVEAVQQRLETKLPGSFQRLKVAFKDGISMTTDYSGVGAAELVMRSLRTALHSSTTSSAADEAPEVEETMRMVWATDIDPLCRKVLWMLQPEATPSCIFSDLCDRVPKQLMRKWTLLRQKILTGLKKRKMKAETVSPAEYQEISQDFIQKARLFQGIRGNVG